MVQIIVFIKGEDLNILRNQLSLIPLFVANKLICPKSKCDKLLN